MKSKHVFCVGVLLALTFILGPNLLSFQQTANELYQAGVLKKSGDGNLEEAIKLFQKIVDNFPDNRELASQALLQIGLCYDLLGEKKAETTFRKLIADYPDQKDTVQIAREKLALLFKKTEEPSRDQGKLTLREISSPYEEPWPFGGPSPDGKFFAFIDWDRGSNLSLFDINSKTIIPLTSYEQTSLSWCDDPIWSNDSSNIAYIYHTQDQKDEVHTISISDKRDRIIYQDSNKRVAVIIDWSPDHKKLYVDIQYKNWDRSIGYISMESGQLTEIINPKQIIHSYNGISPDGNFLAGWIRNESGNLDIHVLSTDGKVKNMLVEHAAKDLFLEWTPDGNHILFSSDRSGAESIWLLPVKDGKPNGEPTLIHNPSGSFMGYGFTNSGKYYFSESFSEKDVYIAKIDLDTGKTIKAPERIEKAIQGHSRTPFWSPDGKKLGYFFKQGGSFNNFPSLKIRSFPSGETKEFLLDILPWESNKQSPMWTEDGKYVHLLANKKNREGIQLYRIDTKSGETKQFSETKRIQAFSHDMSLIYRTESLPIRDPLKRQYWLILRNSKGLEKEILRSPIGSSIAAISLSPNKEWLGYRLMASGEKEMVVTYYIMPADGGKALNLTNKFDMSYPYNWYDWGPQGKGMIFRKNSSSDDKNQKIELWYIPNFQSNESPRKLELTMSDIKDISFHPDGQTIAFTGQTYTSKFWVLENFLPSKEDK